MTTQRLTPSVSRRTTLAAIAGGGLGMALFTGSQAAPVELVDYSDHPLCGVWLAMANPPLPESPQIPVPSIFAADGTVVLSFPLVQLGPNGVQFNSAHVGVWEPYDDQIGHFTATQSISDIEGTLLSTVTVDGHPHVNADGQTFIDDGSLVTVTIRDATGAEIAVVPPGTPGRPVTAVRMSSGVSGFPGNAPGEGTPIS
ncbi:MAG: hypothetical protein H0T72_09015 [Chloroflexia bacterium]|nr:hypothetical protein [Chloroflexia bacterium]